MNYNLIIFSACIVLTLLGTIEAATLQVCGDNEDVELPRDYLEKPQCFEASTVKIEEDCHCGIAYAKDEFGRCSDCSEGFSRNGTSNECVHCPSGNERWCSAQEKCICQKNFHRSESDLCVPCGEHEESNGYAGCQCKKNYKRIKRGDCVKSVAGECPGPWLVESFNKTLNTFECVCIKGYKRVGDTSICRRLSSGFGTKAIVSGIISFGLLGLALGYLIREYGCKCCRRN